MMKKFLIVLTLAISLLGITEISQTENANAADASRFNPGRIIDDRIFTDTSSMNVQEIQNFLNFVNGTGSTCLKNYVTDKPLGSNTYGGPVSAAQAIYDVSQIYGLNPQVILVTLQKEQGLITTTNCSASKYRSAMGFGCPDTAPCDAQWYGLSKQLFQGARHLKGFYNNSLTYVPFKVGTYYIGWHPNSACGGTNVNIQTRGTASLYSYTPYQPNAAALGNPYGTGNSCSSYGNRNFFMMFSDWFGSPTGDLVRTMSNKTVYLLGDGAKYPITSEAILSDYAVLGPVNFVDDAFLNAIPTAPALGRMVGSTTTNKLYLISQGRKYDFTSCEQVEDYGFECAATFRLTPSQLALFQSYPSVAPLLKTFVSNTVYYVQDGKKLPIPSLTDLYALNVGAEISWVDTSFVNSLPTGDKAVTGGSLIKTADSVKVYVVNDWSDSPSIFPVNSFHHTVDLGLGYNYTLVSNSQLAKYSVGSILKTTVQCGSTTYVGSNGYLYEIDPSLYSHFGYNSGTFQAGGEICDRFTISPTDMTRYIKNGVSIFRVENGTKRKFASYAAYLANIGSNTVITVSTNYANSIPNGTPITS